MNRKLLRKKKEYLMKKENEHKNLEIERKKLKLAEAMDNTEKLSYDLRKEGKNILNEMIYNQKVDDIEHRLPKLLITTSKNPSSKLIQFAKHLSLILNGLHYTRGNTSEAELSEIAHKQSFTCLILIYESKGVPSTLTISSFPFGDTMRFRIFNFSQVSRKQNLGEKIYFIADKLDSDIGKKIKTQFSLFFPKCENAKRILTLANRDEKIGFRHYIIGKNQKKTELYLDFGCDLKLFEIRKGTFEQDGDIEWVYKPFISSSKSNMVLTTDTVDE